MDQCDHRDSDTYIVRKKLLKKLETSYERLRKAYLLKSECMDIDQSTHNRVEFERNALKVTIEKCLAM